MDTWKVPSLLMAWMSELVVRGASFISWVLFSTMGT